MKHLIAAGTTHARPTTTSRVYERVLRMGSSGDSPAPVGDPPTGMAEACLVKRPASLARTVTPVPSGGSPDGTGGSPVLPSGCDGFTARELVVMVGALALLAALAVPVLANSKLRSQRAVCANNLALIGRAFARWSNEHGDRYPVQLDHERSSCVPEGCQELRGSSEAQRAIPPVSAPQSAAPRKRES